MTKIHIPSSRDSPGLCASDSGSGGLPAIFIHSLGGTHGHWSAQLQFLREERRALALDLRGHGGSSMPEDGDFSINSLAKDVDSLVRHRDLRRYVLVGHSLGGIVALADAGAHPDRVAGLLLADPSGDARQVPREQMSQFLAALESEAYSRVVEDYWKEILAGSRPGVREKVLADLRATPQQAVTAIFRSLAEFDPRPSLQSFSGPRLSVITPFNDAPFSLHHIDPDLPHLLISGTSHWLHMDRPEEFNSIMRKFLTAVESENQEG